MIQTYKDHWKPRRPMPQSISSRFVRFIVTIEPQWMIYCAIMFHFIWGVGLAYEPTVRKITGISAMSWFMPNHLIESFLLVLFGFVAFIGLCLPENFKRSRLYTMLGQQLLLMISFAGAIVSVFRGQYPDGYVPDGGGIFIFCDQAPVMCIAIWHTVAIIYLHCREPL